MVFSNTSTKAGIIQMIEKTLNLGDAYISGTALELAYFTNIINTWYQLVGDWLWMIDKNWQYDDANYITSFPIATTTLVDDQRDYTLATNMREIKQVEVMGTNGKYFSLKMMSDDSPILNMEKFQETAGTPTYYRKTGRSIFLYPKPDAAMVTVAAGLRITFDKKVDLFVVGDTTQAPGFDEAYHSLLYYGPCWEWAMAHNNAGIAQMCQRMIGNFPDLLTNAKQHYSNRDKKDVDRIGRLRKSYK